MVSIWVLFGVTKHQRECTGVPESLPPEKAESDLDGDSDGGGMTVDIKGRLQAPLPDGFDRLFLDAKPWASDWNDPFRRPRRGYDDVEHHS